MATMGSFQLWAVKNFQSVNYGRSKIFKVSIMGGRKFSKSKSLSNKILLKLNTTDINNVLATSWLLWRSCLSFYWVWSKDTLTD